VQRDERLRLFCALRLPHDAREAIAAWQLAALPAGEVRHVAPANLHVTLAFLGSRPALEVPAIAAALGEAAAGGSRPSLLLRGYRETRSAGMLTFDDPDGAARALAERLHGRLEELGVYHPEPRAWLPHVTVLRFRQRPRLRPALPELGAVVPSDAAVFISRLRPGGAEYESVETVALGG
jgi:2'-5' RNA ligase